MEARTRCRLDKLSPVSCTSSPVFASTVYDEMLTYQYPFVPLDCKLLKARTRVCLVHQQVAQRPQSTPVCCMGEMDEGPWGGGGILQALGESRRITRAENVGRENVWAMRTWGP